MRGGFGRPGFPPFCERLTGVGTSAACAQRVEYVPPAGTNHANRRRRLGGVFATDGAVKVRTNKREASRRGASHPGTFFHVGVEQSVARLAHNQEVAGSSPAAATKSQAKEPVAIQPGEHRQYPRPAGGSSRRPASRFAGCRLVAVSTAEAMRRSGWKPRTFPLSALHPRDAAPSAAAWKADTRISYRADAAPRHCRHRIGNPASQGPTGQCVQPQRRSSARPALEPQRRAA